MIAKNKIRATCILVACVGIGVAVLLLPSTRSPIDVLTQWVSQTTAMSLVLIFVFDRWLWKIIPECILGVPKIYGTWKGNLYHSQLTENGAKQEGTVEPFFLCIHQNFCSLTIQAISEKSDSVSTVASLKKGPTVWEIIYAYDNSPALQHQTNSRRHRGAATIQIQPTDTGRKLVGEYWTDRWSQGHMTLENHTKEIVTDFVASRKICQ